MVIEEEHLQKITYPFMVVLAVCFVDLYYSSVVYRVTKYQTVLSMRHMPRDLS